jgi:hypothetical protein
MARNGALFISKAYPKGVDIYVNPGRVFGVVGDGEGGTYIHSGTGFCYHVVGEPEQVDRTLALWGSEDGSDQT